jgi:hypothetical protein
MDQAGILSLPAFNGAQENGRCDTQSAVQQIVVIFREVQRNFENEWIKILAEMADHAITCFSCVTLRHECSGGLNITSKQSPHQAVFFNHTDFDIAGIQHQPPVASQ